MDEVIAGKWGNGQVRKNKLTEADERQFERVFKHLNGTDVVIDQSEYVSRKFTLPNAWYITPYNYLYNTMGPNGHKGSNLIYAWWDIQRGYPRGSKKYYLDKIQTINETNRINRDDYMLYVHLVHDFVSLRPGEYIAHYSYDQKMIKLVIGILYAHAGFSEFFEYLKKYSADYQADLKYLETLSSDEYCLLDEILIRCCGFHRVLLVGDKKIISTSCLDYEEEFKEYIEKGWTIDFVKPITLNYFGRLAELDDDFIKTRMFRKKD